MGNLEKQSKQSAKAITITSREEAIQAHEALRKYIFEKIENKEYRVLDISRHTVAIAIDTYFDLCVWVANGVDSVSLYGANYDKIGQDHLNGINSIGFRHGLTDNEKELLFSELGHLYDDIEKEEKMKQYNQLKTELGL